MKILKERGASTLETKELYSDSQQQAVNMKILESRKRAKVGMVEEREASPASQGEGRAMDQGRAMDPGRALEHGRAPYTPGQLAMAHRQIEMAGRPPGLFGLPAQKYF